MSFRSHTSPPMQPGPSIASVRYAPRVPGVDLVHDAESAAIAGSTHTRPRRRSCFCRSCTVAARGTAAAFPAQQSDGARHSELHKCAVGSGDHDEMRRCPPAASGEPLALEPGPGAAAIKRFSSVAQSRSNVSVTSPGHRGERSAQFSERHALNNPLAQPRPKTTITQHSHLQQCSTV